MPAYDESELQSILQDFDLVNYVDESYFSYNVDLYLANDYNKAMEIRTKPQFLFLLFYFSKKYNLKIRCIEEEVSGKLTDIKIYLDRNPEVSFISKIQSNMEFELTYLVFYIKYLGIRNQNVILAVKSMIIRRSQNLALGKINVDYT